MRSNPPPSNVLLVEGKDDENVISHLCLRHSIQVPDCFQIISGTTNDNGEQSGFRWILDEIPVRVKQSMIQSVGIVMDADEDIKSRWDSISGRLRTAGYLDLPSMPDPNGTILYSKDRPKAGIWIMPDNQLKGMLEDFVIDLIPEGDLLFLETKNFLARVEEQGLNHYDPFLHHSKALIHSWLACQKNPGRQMGTALRCRYLSSDYPIAQKFIEWLRELYTL